MVSENDAAPTQDAIDQEQYRLDAQQQGSTEEPQYVTVSQYNQLQSQLRTVQGMLHKGLNTATNNAIQGAKTYFDAEMSKLNQGAQVEQIMSTVPEENQEWARQLLAATMQQQQQATPQVETGTSDRTQASTDAYALWEQWFDMAREWGLDPTDSRIQWNLVTDGDHTASQRLARVNKHFANLVTAAPTRPVAPSPTPAPAPPVENGPGPSTINDGSFEALLDNIAARRITFTEGRQIAAKNGWQL